MKESNVLKKLRAGSLVSCTKLNSSDHRLVELAALCGFDCIWVDMEHVPNDMETVERQILAARAIGADMVARVARGSYSDHVRALEAGATGVMVPHVMGLEDAKRVVRMTRFHPVGRRPLDGGNADGAYCMIGTLDYMRQSNEERFVMIQIEDPEPMAELDAICELEGIDVIFFGPGDYSHGIGHPGDTGHPEVLRAQLEVAQAARRHGKFAGTVGTPESIGELWKMGYQFISCGADVLGLGGYFSAIAKAFRETGL
jgi:4-hydroxy-2-oxoheptanedioate aldolase